MDESITVMQGRCFRVIFESILFPTKSCFLFKFRGEEQIKRKEILHQSEKTSSTIFGAVASSSGTVTNIYFWAHIFFFRDNSFDIEF